MKQAIFTLILLAAIGIAAPARGQFLKNVLNSVKNTVQNRANDKADQTTNKVIDKTTTLNKTSGTNSGATGAAGASGTTTGASSTTAGATSINSLPGAGNIDTSGFSRILGAFAQTAAANPNDTNSADLLMKSLGRLTGGEPISAADSAAAINSFKTAGGGSGVVYMTITNITSSKGATKDTSTSWYTSSGEARMEMRLPFPGVVTPKMITIGRAKSARFSMSLHPDTKTYSLNVIDTSLINSGIEKYQVTRVGAETVSGYSCIHSRVTSTTGSGMFKSSSTSDVWTSTDVPGYSIYSKLMSMQSNQVGMLAALTRAGASGYLVKMSAGDKDYSMTMVLVSARQESFPASMFEIPSGYTFSNQNIMESMFSGATPARQ